MDRATLDALGEVGLAAVPGGRLTDLVIWCREWCEATGDVRYCTLGRVLSPLDSWLTAHDESGGVPTALRQHIDETLRQWVPDGLLAASGEEGSAIARLMGEEVARYLLPPEQWPT